MGSPAARVPILGRSGIRRQCSLGRSAVEQPHSAPRWECGRSIISTHSAELIRPFQELELLGWTASASPAFGVVETPTNLIARMICELGIGLETAMPRKEGLAKLKDFFSSQAASDHETAGTAHQGLPAQQPGQSNTDQTPSVDGSSIVKLLEETKNTIVEEVKSTIVKEIKGPIIEVLTNLRAHSSQTKDGLARIDARIAEFVTAVTGGKDEERTHYTTREFAEKLMKEGVHKFKGGLEDGGLERGARRVQLWCNAKRINATKRPSGRGENGEWMIPHTEYVRFKNHGLLPRPKD